MDLQDQALAAACDAMALVLSFQEQTGDAYDSFGSSYIFQTYR